MNGQVFSRFYALVRQIPPGQAATYGQIARLAGMPRCARLVGYAMAACQDPGIPCHRVVDRMGGTKAAFDILSPGRCWKRKAFLSAPTALWIWIDACGTAAHPHEGVLHHIAAESQKSAGDEKSPALFFIFQHS